MNTYVYMIEIAHFIFIYFVFNDNVFMLRVKILISVQVCCIYILAWQVFPGRLSKKYFEFRNRHETQVTHNNHIEGYFDHKYRLEVEHKGGWNILSGGQLWISFSISD